VKSQAVRWRNTAVLPLFAWRAGCRLLSTSNSLPLGKIEKELDSMDLYTIRRRSNWSDAAELEATAAKSSAEGEKMSDEVRWIRSYVVEEPDGKLGTVCLYEAVSPEAISRHAGNTGMSADEIFKVADTVIVREDPVSA
jgi:hypothetical protein